MTFGRTCRKLSPHCVASDPARLSKWGFSLDELENGRLSRITRQRPVGRRDTGPCHFFIGPNAERVFFLMSYSRNTGALTQKCCSYSSFGGVWEILMLNSESVRQRTAECSNSHSEAKCFVSALSSSGSAEIEFASASKISGSRAKPVSVSYAHWFTSKSNSLPLGDQPTRRTPPPSCLVGIGMDLKGASGPLAT